jgi:hypothetical protein
MGTLVGALFPWAATRMGIKQRLVTVLVSACFGVLGGILAWVSTPVRIPLFGYGGNSPLTFAVIFGFPIATAFIGTKFVRYIAQRRARDEQAPAERLAKEEPAPLAAPAPVPAPHPLSIAAAHEQFHKQTRIFISYRREGDAAQAGRIADLLLTEFPDSVFLDVNARQLGRDFVERINQRVAICDVLLAVIGPNWLDARNKAGQRRLDIPTDFVRVEIAAALKRNIPVIPILVDGTEIPSADSLPEDLQKLARRDAFDLRNATFKTDMDILVRDLKAIKGS